VILALASATADRRGADQQGLWGTLHVAGTGETTWFDFAMRIFDHMARTEGRRPALRPLSAAEYPTPARRPANSRLDCARLRAVFGLATPPWEESLERTLDALDALEGLATPPGCLTEKNR
ncbi:MAG TPA: sugar nucleotide-binding protein, partial [Azospirillaceae bacterium]|nr:sugar nucleotide-binding protein [Azospirillaceae bacterium]